VHDPYAGPDPWKSASWAGAEATILEAGARLSLADRLLWLEQAAAAARALSRAGAAANPGVTRETTAAARQPSDE
jgi:hypothetical protein